MSCCDLDQSRLDLCQDGKSLSSSLWKLVSSGGVRKQLERKTPNSASQQVTSRQERDLDQRKIWRECVYEYEYLLYSSNSVLISSLMPSPLFCFRPLLWPQMLPGHDGIAGIVPWQHLSGWSGPDRCWTSQGLIPGECSQQDQSSAGKDFYSRRFARKWAFTNVALLKTLIVMSYHRWSFSSRRCI